MARTLAEAVGREELEAVEGRLTGLIRQNTDRLDDIDVKLGRVDGRLRALAENGIRMEGRLDRMEADITTMKQDITAMTQNVDTIKTAVNSLLAQLPPKDA